MRIILFLLSLSLSITGCSENDHIPDNKQTNIINPENAYDSILTNNAVYLNDGWPEGLPKDTVPDIPLKSYSPLIETAIIESALKRDELQKMEINQIEVYRNRAWDGEKWYTTQNEYTVLLSFKNSIDHSRWIVPVEYVNGEYITKEWIEK